MTCQHCGVEGDHVKKYSNITVLKTSLPLCPKCHHEQKEYLDAYNEYLRSEGLDQGNEGV